MKFSEHNPPRIFTVGSNNDISIADCARIELAPNEQVTFVTEKGGEYDMARKSWGFYATPSLNGRLKKFGFRAALVKGEAGNYHIWLIENGAEQALKEYLTTEKHTITAWLDSDEELEKIESTMQSETIHQAGSAGCLCGNQKLNLVHTYDTPPPGEKLFGHIPPEEYSRSLYQCPACSHYVSCHSFDKSKLNNGDYVASHYTNQNGLLETFNKIMSLPPDKSDNQARVKRILQFASSIFDQHDEHRPRILDVGSGLCVFLALLKQKSNWHCTALDTDPRQQKHAQVAAGVNALCGDFLSLDDLGTYDVITFNKVLEHVDNPVALLKKGSEHLNQDGFIYIELPDAENAAKDSFSREEFFIDHPHIFSSASTAILAQKAGLQIIRLEKIREPSNKYSIMAFLRP